MKIGIMTFWQAKENYGQILQLYALTTFLKELGHSPFLIRYDRIKGDTSPLRFTLHKLKLLAHPLDLFNLIKNKLCTQQTLADRGFQQFINQHIDTTKEIYDSVSILQQAPPQADMYICGSDQIWNQTQTSFSSAFFLNFGSANIKRVAYAASFGKPKLSKPLTKKIQPLLQQFSFISIREEEGLHICKTMGIDAYRVPDPTMLIDWNLYMQKLSINSYEQTDPYIMMYLLGHDTWVPFGNIYNWAANSKYHVRYVASDFRNDKYKKEMPTIPQWLSMMKHARYVITNSFHGTVFAILFNIPFAVLPLKGKFATMNGRIHTLLKDLGLEDRILRPSKPINEILSQPINYDRINQIINNNRLTTRNLLKQKINL